MELLLIRHGLPIRRELAEGAADPPLSEDGQSQAQHLGQYLSSEDLDAVYTSPMRRAAETAAPVVAGRDLEVVHEPDVAEFDRDSSEYVPVEELKASNDPRWQAMIDGTWDGLSEPHDVFAERVIGAIERIIGAHRSQKVAITCHGGVINAYVSHLLGIDPGQRGFFYPNYTSIHRVAAASSGERMIVSLNETTHLRNTGLPMGLFQHG